MSNVKISLWLLDRFELTAVLNNCLINRRDDNYTVSETGLLCIILLVSFDIPLHCVYLAIQPT